MKGVKKSINEVYQDKHFDQNKQLETLRKVRLEKQKNRRTYWLPLITAVGALFIALLLITIERAEMPSQTTSTSSITAPQNADEVFVKRVHHFWNMIADGVMTEDERRAYLSTSDWLLQRAFESGASIFYNRPNMTTEEITAVNTLLFSMNQFVEQRHDPSVLQRLTSNQEGFRDLLQVVPHWNTLLQPYTTGQYLPSESEKPRSKNVFLASDLWKQLIIVAALVLVVYAFYFNMRHKRKRMMALVQLSLIVVFSVMLIRPDTNLYGYDETSMMTSIVTELERLEVYHTPVTFLAGAIFSEKRFGLVELAQGEGIGLGEFSLLDDQYVYTDSTYHKFARVVTQHVLQDSLGEEGVIVAIADNSKISKVVVTDHKTKEQYAIDVDPVHANIYRILLPDKVTSYLVDTLDAAGEVVK